MIYKRKSLSLIGEFSKPVIVHIHVFSLPCADKRCGIFVKIPTTSLVEEGDIYSCCYKLSICIFCRNKAFPRRTDKVNIVYRIISSTRCYTKGEENTQKKGEQRTHFKGCNSFFHTMIICGKILLYSTYVYKGYFSNESDHMRLILPSKTSTTSSL